MNCGDMIHRSGTCKKCGRYRPSPGTSYFGSTCTCCPRCEPLQSPAPHDDELRRRIAELERRIGHIAY
jgi:hypothetical protein